MSEYTAIADVGDTLIELLRENMSDLITADEIMLISPGEIEARDKVRLSLFLYQILENVHLKNQEVQVIDPTTLRHPPLTLDLYYMLTSYPSQIQDRTDRTKEEHSILGRAMQVFYDNAVLSGSVLKGSLAENSDLHLMLSPLNLDDMTKIWTTFQEKPFRPSACYLVTPVMVDSTREISTQRVIFKEMNHYYSIPERK